MRARGDRRRDGGLAPAHERPDGRDEDVAGVKQRGDRAVAAGRRRVGDRGSRGRAPRPAPRRGRALRPASSGRAPRATSARAVSSPVNPVAPKSTMRADTRPTLARAPPREVPCRDGRTGSRGAPDHLRHVHGQRPARRRRLRQGLARGARHPGRGARVRRPSGRARRRRARRRAVRDLPRSRRRRAGPRRAVHAARRGRPPDRPRRLRHEGRPRGDDVRRPRRRAQRQGARALHLRARRGVRRRRLPLHARRSSQEGLRADFAITGEPTDLHIGVQAKGVLAVRVEVSRDGRARLDAVARATTRSSRRTTYSGGSRLYASAASRPISSTGPRSTSRASTAATRSTRCPTSAAWTSTSATSPTRIPARSSPRSGRCPTCGSSRPSSARPRTCRARNPYVRALREAVSKSLEGEALSIGRDGASDAISFLEAGVPAVEFGPVGGGHHGPEEWVSIDSLARYRRALGDFVHGLPAWLAAAAPDKPLAARRRRRARVSVYEYEDGPAAEREMGKRFAVGGLLIVLLTATAVAEQPAARGARGRDGLRARVDADPGHQERPRRGPRRRSADDPAARLRPPLRRRQGQPAALGHDHRRAPGPRQERHRDHVAAARPQGRRSPATGPRRSTRPTTSAGRSSRCGRSAACSGSRSTTSST